MIRDDRPVQNAEEIEITPEMIEAGRYSTEEFQRLLDKARKITKDSNDIFALQKRWL